MEKEMATHSSVLAWETPWTGSLANYSLCDCKTIGHNLAIKRQKQTTDTQNNMANSHKRWMKEARHQRVNTV